MVWIKNHDDLLTVYSDKKIIFKKIGSELALKIEFKFWECPIFDSQYQFVSQYLSTSKNQFSMLIGVYKTIELYLPHYKFPQLSSCYWPPCDWQCQNFVLIYINISTFTSVPPYGIHGLSSTVPSCPVLLYNYCSPITKHH